MSIYQQFVEALESDKVEFYRNLSDGSLLEIDMRDGKELLFESSTQVLMDFSSERTPTHIEIGKVTDRRILKLLTKALKTAPWSDERVRPQRRA